jgi:hypothetical protein
LEPGVEPPRSPPPGVDGDAVNWLCVPPDAGTQLNPNTVQMNALLNEARTIYYQLS